MLHPRFTTSTGLVVWAGEIGKFGTWGDLAWITRWGNGASGMFEASFTMPLPPDYEHPVLKRGVGVDLMDGSLRVGSPTVISQIERGTYGNPWKITCEGVGRLVEGPSSFYAFDGSGNVTTTPSTAIDQAMARGLLWGGRDTTVSTSAFGTAGEPQTIGSLLNSIAAKDSTHWGVWDEHVVGFRSDPTTPVWQVTPNAVVLGVADDDYATVEYVRYTDSGTGLNATVHSPASAPAAESAFVRQEHLTDLTVMPPMSAATAQGYADGIYTRTKGRLAFTNRLTLTANELSTMGGESADLTMVEAGQMVRLHGVSSDLLEFNGLTYVDFVIGEAKPIDGARSIEIAPAGLAARDRASIMEDVTGMAAAA